MLRAKKIISLLLLSLVSSHSFSESVESKHPEINTAAVNDVFTYPPITHTESEAFYNDVLFFYSPESFAAFNNDHELMLHFINGSIDINNDMLRKSDIALRRNVSAVLPLPDGTGIVDSDYEHENKINRLVDFYENTTDNNYQAFYDASYVSVLLEYYPNNGRIVGQAAISGYASWISPNRGDDPTSALAHELGHNDGLVHNKDETAGREPLLLKPYAVGGLCNSSLNRSLMNSPPISTNREIFLSSPLTTISTGDECGVNDESDAVRAYKAGIIEKLPNSRFPWLNNKPTPEKTGEVSISAVNSTVEGGEDIAVDILWQGASIGDAAQVLLKRNGLQDAVVESFMQRIIYDGNNVQRITIPTLPYSGDDKLISVDVIYPHKINLGISETEITLVSNIALVPGKFNLSIEEADIQEGGDVEITVLRTGGTYGDITINLSTINGTAEGETDFTPLNLDLEFADGVSEMSFVVSALSDDIVDPDEVFTVSLSSEQNVLGQQTEALITIIDNTVPEPKPGTFNFSSDTLSVSEGGRFMLSIVRTDGADGAVSLTVKTNAGSATEGDFEATNDTVSFADGEITKSIELQTLSDDIDETNETFTVTISSDNANIGDTSSVEITIIEAEKVITPGVFNLASTQLTVDEGGSTTLTVNRSEGSDGEVTINLSSAIGTASASDFSSVNETLTFADGETSKSITLSANSDSVVENAETFTVTLSSTSGDVGSSNTATVRIVDRTPKPPTNTPTSSNKDSGGGSVGLSIFLLLGIAVVRRRTR